MHEQSSGVIFGTGCARTGDGWDAERVEITGLGLARRYYQECVAPIVLSRWPGLPHAGARLGSGSDVLGLDDAMSRDHDWGLRLTLLVGDAYVVPVRELLESTLPQSFLGLPTRFGTTWMPGRQHQVEVDTASGFAASRLGLPPKLLEGDGNLDARAWLTLTGQALLEVTAGEVFADTAGDLTRIRAGLGWYPDDVWRYVVAAAWVKLGEELPLLGRSGSRGDELGSRILVARLAGVAMQLGFILERRWPPYSKWLGTLFARLPRASAAGPALSAALAADTWPERQDQLSVALEILHDLQRAAGLPTGDRAVEPFWDRPFRGVQVSVTRLLHESIVSAEVRGLPRGVGAPEQWSDNVRVLTTPEYRARMPGPDQ